MVDGTGMCGGCRVTVGGESRFACVDGPEFDAHQVDFRNLAQRNQLYRSQERVALQRFLAGAQCQLEQVHACRLQDAHPEIAL
jgi:ferredoxin--NADP+ reductase